MLHWLNNEPPNKNMQIMMRKLFYFYSFVLASLQVQAQKPTITSFSPTSGVIGTTVTITGTNFNTTPAQNTVFFGATKAAVTAATAPALP